MSCGQQLCDTLATTFAFYLEAHQFHWNVEGKDFVQIHDLFGQIYKDVHDSIDTLAEHIRTLDIYAPVGFTNLADMSKLSIVTDIPTCYDMVEILLNDNRIVLEELNTAFDMATEERHQGIANFIADRISKHEKWQWILRSITKDCDNE